MKPVERYHAELEHLTAPDSLKEKLYAIPTQMDAADPSAQADTFAATLTSTAPADPNTSTTTQAPQGRTPRTKNTIRFALPPNWKKYALTAAACFAVGVLATDALNLHSLSIMNMGMDSAMDSVMYSTGTTTGTTNSAMMSMDESGYDTATLNLADATLETATASDASYATRSSEDSIATDTTADTAAESSTSSRKIIYTTDLSLETMAYDDTLAALTAAVNAAGGYLEYSELYTNNGYNSNNERAGYFSYRIPAEYYTTFLSGVGEAGNITYQTESANDVTTNYLDLEARITTLTQQRDRLWALQTEAESLTDLLEIEATLTDVLYQIESYQSQLNYLADQVSYATVSIHIEEVIEYTTPEPSTWDVIASTFTSGITSFLHVTGSVLLFVLSIWVWLALAVVGVLVYYGIKRKKHNQ